MLDLLKVNLLKTAFNQRHNTWIIIPAVLMCLAGLSLSHLPSLSAQETPDAASKKPAPESKEPPKTVTAERPAAADPNTTVSDNEDDIFDLSPSSLPLINEAYSRIFTPNLITEDGRVKYSTLRRKRLDVLNAERELKKLNPVILMNLSKEERQAFWINTYNFCTIKLILDNYPIQPKWFMIIYPDDSIMQITGAWTKVFFDIQRFEYNLQEIEQDFLLKRYKDPRICFALSNASMGGALLRNEPYHADRLDDQLNDQIQKYLKTDKGMRLDKTENILHLSNLFQMHKETFLASEYASIKKFRGRKDHERVWLNFILPYLSNENISYIETHEPAIKFINFDWHLNEAK